MLITLPLMIGTSTILNGNHTYDLSLAPFLVEFWNDFSVFNDDEGRSPMRMISLGIKTY